MVELAGLCFYVAVLYTILVCYRFDFLKLPATLRTFARRNNLGIDSAFITVVPIFFVRYGIFSLEMGLKRG